MVRIIIRVQRNTNSIEKAKLILELLREADNKTYMKLIINSKYFPDSDWLKAHV